MITPAFEDGQTDLPAWSLRYAPHLGYAPPELSQFPALAGPALVDQVHFAARQGFAGLFDPWAGGRSEQGRSTITSAMATEGLSGGCIVALPRALTSKPVWVQDRTDELLLGHVRRACGIADEMRSSVLAVIVAGDPDTSQPVQKRRALEALRRAADIAADNQMTLAIEPMVRLPGMLLQRFAEGLELVETANHPSLRLIYDTAHCRDMGEDPLAMLKAGYDRIATVQLADWPDRVEPGDGEIDFVAILAELMRRDHDGLIELEYNWRSPGRDAELSGLRTLRELDASARGLAGPGGAARVRSDQEVEG